MCMTRGVSKTRGLRMNLRERWASAVVVDISRHRLKWDGIEIPWNRTRIFAGECWLNGELAWG